MVELIDAHVRHLTDQLPKLIQHYFIRLIHPLPAALFVLSVPFAAHAVPIDTSLTITASVQFDTVNSSAASGGATQHGSFSGTFNAANTSSTINDTTVTGSNPLSGNMTEIGDGLESVLNIAGSAGGENGGMFTDFFVDITNNSATDQFLITFAVDFSNTVDANGGDAYADSQLSIFDDTAFIEVFFTDLTSDTFFGDMFNGTDPGTFGDALSDIGIATFDITIDPLATINLSGLNSIEGGAYSGDGNYSGQLETVLSVVEVTNLTNPIPLPSSLILLSMGLASLVVGRRRP
jgi:hypothetical protein